MMRGMDLPVVPALLPLGALPSLCVRPQGGSCQLLPRGCHIVKQLHPHWQQLPPSPATSAQGHLMGSRSPALSDLKSWKCLLLARSKGKIVLPKFPRRQLGTQSGMGSSGMYWAGCLGSRRVLERSRDMVNPSWGERGSMHSHAAEVIHPPPSCLGFGEL